MRLMSLMALTVLMVVMAVMVFMALMAWLALLALVAIMAFMALKSFIKFDAIDGFVGVDVPDIVYSDDGVGAFDVVYGVFFGEGADSVHIVNDETFVTKEVIDNHGEHSHLSVALKERLQMVCCCAVVPAWMRAGTKGLIFQCSVMLICAAHG